MACRDGYSSQPAFSSNMLSARRRFGWKTAGRKTEEKITFSSSARLIYVRFRYRSVSLKIFSCWFRISKWEVPENLFSGLNFAYKVACRDGYPESNRLSQAICYRRGEDLGERRPVQKGRKKSRFIHQLAYSICNFDIAPSVWRSFNTDSEFQTERSRKIRFPWWNSSPRSDQWEQNRKWLVETV